MKLYMANTGLNGNLEKLFSIFKESKASSLIRLDISIFEEMITIGNNKIGDTELLNALNYLENEGKKKGDGKKEKHAEPGKRLLGNLTDLRIGMNQIQDSGCIKLSKVLEQQDRMEVVDLCTSLY